MEQRFYVVEDYRGEHGVLADEHNRVLASDLELELNRDFVVHAPMARVDEEIPPGEMLLIEPLDGRVHQFLAYTVLREEHPSNGYRLSARQLPPELAKHLRVA